MSDVAESVRFDMTAFPYTALLALVVFLPMRAHAGKGELPTGDFTLIFVGGAAGDDGSATLGRLRQRLSTLDPLHGRVVFTGNYSRGELPAEEEPGRAEAERQILVHVAATRDFVQRGGKVVFLPGHLDFASGGSRAIRRLRTFLNHAFGPQIDVMPEAACGDSTVLELTDTLGLLLVNSQWWMQDREADPEANLGCEVKSTEEFRLHVRDAFNEYRTRRLVVASHHPLRSYGELGGGFTVQAHLQPAPVLGTAVVLAAHAGLLSQYSSHPRVSSYVALMKEEAVRYGTFVFASGHDSNLQFVAAGGQIQIISGTSSASPRPTAPADEGDFAAGASGWAELTIGPSGGGTTKFFSGANGQLLFEGVIPPLEPFAASLPAEPRPFPSPPVITTYSKSGGQKMGGLAKFFLGSFYGDAYALQLPYDLLDLTTEQGGLEPIRTGGSFQTNALRLRDSHGGSWTVRATTKDSSRLLGARQKEGSAAGGTVSHAFTGTHPEAALAVPRLATAVGVLHAEPRLMYLPDQTGLGKFRGYISDEPVMLERSPSEPKDGVLPESLAGQPTDEGETRFRTTVETIEKVNDNPAKHRVDQEAWLRARLLDILLGDWDRHQNQWRFAAIPQADGSKKYEPIPRDRDQAFANYDGLGLGLARLSALQTRRLQPYTGEMGSLVWLIYAARDLDPIFLNQLSRARWLEIATEVKDALTDTVIDEAFSTWHPEAYALDGSRIAAALKVRRDTLVNVAGEYFKLINQNVDVVGSTHDDTFELWFLEHGAVRVSVRAREGRAVWFDRVFQAAQTRELRLYGLQGDDTLWVHGTPHSEIAIRFVGGEGNDQVTARPEAKVLRATAIHLYDGEDGAQVDPSIEVSDERSRRACLNQYDRTENHEPNAATFIPGVLIDPDDGVLVGANATYLVQGFKKTPFAARHEFVARFATATLGAAVDYRGLFPQSTQLLDQEISLSIRAPTWTRNFFGYSNAFVGDGEPLDFYRVRQAAYEARAGLSYGFGGDRSRVGAQVLGQAFVTEATPGRFVARSSDVAADALGARGFVGARLFASFKTFDNLALPTRGISVSASVESRLDALNGNALSANGKVTAGVALPLDRARRFVLLSRVALEGIIGAHPFYFSPTLGDTELRAYHPQQLTGDAAFSQTSDLRIDVVRLGSAGAIGVNLSVDHGRAFGPSIRGNLWHLSFGGGLWWSVMDTLVFSAGYYRGLDGGSRFTVLLGPLFAPSAM